MFRRSLSIILRSPSGPIIRSRSLTQTTATLQISPNVTQSVNCSVEGAPLYSVILPKRFGSALSGRDLGAGVARVDLLFYGGCHFACDKDPQSPRLTLGEDVSGLIDRSGGKEEPAMLYYCNDVEGSAITLKGTEGEEMWEHTTDGAEYLDQALRDMK